MSNNNIRNIPDLDSLLQRVQYDPAIVADSDCAMCKGSGVDGDGAPCDCAYKFVGEQVIKSLQEDLDWMFDQQKKGAVMSSASER